MGELGRRPGQGVRYQGQEGAVPLGRFGPIADDPEYLGQHQDDSSVPDAGRKHWHGGGSGARVLYQCAASAEVSSAFWKVLAKQKGSLCGSLFYWLDCLFLWLVAFLR